jgi:sigma-B regulation protein RsbU (phosphoserine phosphatase)
VTFAAVIIDPREHTVTVVNAGHINPMVLAIGGGGSFVDCVTNDESGLPLGLVPGMEYAAKVLPLACWDTLLVFTDGVIDAEAPSDARFNFDGIHAAVKAIVGSAGDVRPRHVGERIVKACLRHMAGRAQFDDIAVVCFGRVDSALGAESHAPALTEPIPRQEHA